MALSDPFTISNSKSQRSTNIANVLAFSEAKRTNFVQPKHSLRLRRAFGSRSWSWGRTPPAQHVIAGMIIDEKIQYENLSKVIPKTSQKTEEINTSQAAIESDTTVVESSQSDLRWPNLLLLYIKAKQMFKTSMKRWIKSLKLPFSVSLSHTQMLNLPSILLQLSYQSKADIKKIFERVEHYRTQVAFSQPGIKLTPLERSIVRWLNAVPFSVNHQVKLKGQLLRQQLASLRSMALLVDQELEAIDAFNQQANAIRAQEEALQASHTWTKYILAFSKTMTFSSAQNLNAEEDRLFEQILHAKQGANQTYSSLNASMPSQAGKHTNQIVANDESNHQKNVARYADQSLWHIKNLYDGAASLTEQDQTVSNNHVATPRPFKTSI